jgi:hypothetical protein
MTWALVLIGLILSTFETCRCQTQYYNVLSEINVGITLSCPFANNNYYWYKSPNTLLINPTNPTQTIDASLYTLSGANLILNNANRSDIGTDMYYAYDAKLRITYCSFSVYLYRWFDFYVLKIFLSTYNIEIYIRQ